MFDYFKENKLEIITVGKWEKTKLIIQTKKIPKAKKKTLPLSLNYANNQMMTTQFCKKKNC